MSHSKTGEKAGRPVIEYKDKTFMLVKEGLAGILVPHVPESGNQTKRPDQELQTVFYNPIQQFNRDLSVLAIRAFGENDLEVRRAATGQKTKRKQNKQQNGAGNSTSHRKRTADEAFSTPVYSDNASASPHDDSNAKSDHGETVEISSLNVQRGDGLGAKTINGTRVALGDSDGKPDTSMSEEIHQAPGSDNPCAKTSLSADAVPQIPRKPRFKILDALSATGLRAIRYVRELDFVTKVVANDLSKDAVSSIKLNVEYNDLVDKIEVANHNAMAHMYTFAGQLNEAGDNMAPKYDVIDLDPYGTAAPFLDAAVHAVKDGGMLCVTCTDAGVWASCGYPEKTFSTYGGTPIRGPQSHEGGLRLILQAIATNAARYGMAIEPLMSLSIDFYARVFVRVFRSPAEVKLLAGKTMLVYNCDSGCGAWELQRLIRTQALSSSSSNQQYKHSLSQAPTASPHCQHCGSKLHISGPMYGGALHNPKFLSRVLDYLPEIPDETYGTKERIKGMISTALEEFLILPAETKSNVENMEPDERTVPRFDPSFVDSFPFFFIPSALAKVLHCQAPSEAAINGAIRYAGYEATRSHTKPGSIKTSAPWEFIWEVMREWVRQKAPIKAGSLKEGTPGWRIMNARVKSHLEPNQETPDPESTDTKGASTEENGEVSPKNQIVFDERLGREPRKRLVRYQINPRANWGPMNRARPTI